MSTISTHVLDTVVGKPAAGVPVLLEHVDPSGAATQMGADPQTRLAAEPKPKPEDLAQFHKREIVRVIEMLAEIGEVDRVASFQNRLSEVVKTPVEHAMIAMLAESINRPELSVAAAKRWV